MKTNKVNIESLDSFFSFVSKAVIVIPIIILIISLFLKFNSTKTGLVNQTPTVVERPKLGVSTKNNDFKFDLKGPIVCEDLFIKNKKVLFKNKLTNYLLNNDCLYIWDTGKLNGEKKCGLSNYVNMAENYMGLLNINDLVNNSLVKDFIKDKSINVENVIKSCKKGEIKDDKVFEMPKNIIFTPQKMSRLRPTFPSSFDVSIIGADSFHDLVRDGKGWDQVAQVTRTIDSI